MKLKDLTENQVVQTTAENDKQFRELLNNKGFKWCDGDSYVDFSTFGRKETTYYNVTRGTFGTRKLFEEKGKEILQASDFLTKKIKKSELLERIELLEKKVVDLEEKSKVIVEFEQRIEADKPKFEVGTLGAFWDGDYEYAINNLNVHVGYFGGKTDNERFYPLNLTCSWDNFKPLKFDLSR